MGGILVSTANSLNADAIQLNAGGSKGTIKTGAGVTINASNSLVLSATSDIGGKTLIDVNTPNLTVTSGGVVGINDKFGGPVIIQNSTAGKGFTLKTVGDTVLNNIVVANGSITITENAGTLALNNNGLLRATNGGINLLNANAIGNITIGDNADVETLLKGKAVILQIGSTVIPKAGTNPVPAGSYGFGLNVIIDNPKNFVFLGTEAAAAQ